MLCLSGFERYSRWVPLRYNEVSLYGGSFPYFLHLKSCFPVAHIFKKIKRKVQKSNIII